MRDATLTEARTAKLRLERAPRVEENERGAEDWKDFRRPTKDLGSARVREKEAEAMGAMDLVGKAEGLEEIRAEEAAEQAMREDEKGGICSTKSV